MAAATYTCQIIGDGKSPDTAFRPAINDVKDSNGDPAFKHECAIPVDPRTGFPIVASIDVTVEDNRNAALVAGNPLITPAGAATP